MGAQTRGGQHQERVGRGLRNALQVTQVDSSSGGGGIHYNIAAPISDSEGVGAISGYVDGKTETRSINVDSIPIGIRSNRSCPGEQIHRLAIRGNIVVEEVQAKC